VRGAPLELMKARQRRFYFDQGGKLVKHFGIARAGNRRAARAACSVSEHRRFPQGPRSPS
jgi:conjugal transfer pilus assembly protein TraW